MSNSEEEKPNFDKKDIAVALDYTHGKDVAPKIVASGRGSIAAQILAVAKEHNITIHKDTELAQILAVIDIDSIIPVEAYAAVAEILSYIYKINAANKQK